MRSVNIDSSVPFPNYFGFQQNNKQFKDNNIIAICCLQIIEYLPQCNDNGRQGYICNVYTEKEYRNQGIQTRLLKEVIDYSIKNDLCELDLSTNTDNAISLYKKFGFVFDSWAMKKEMIN